MLIALVGLAGFTLLAPPASEQATDVAAIGNDSEPVERATRPLVAPQRVIDTAGFPVSGAQGEEGPVVTVNGRPLDDRVAPVRSGVTPDAPTAQPATGPAALPAAADTPEAAPAVALVAPVPVPRPAGLVRAPAVAGVPEVDDLAVTATVNPGFVAPDPVLREPVPAQPIPAPVPPRAGELVGPVGVVEGFLTLEERQRLAGAPAGREDGLVQVMGPNGEQLWLYPDQARQFGYRVVGQQGGTAWSPGFP